MLGVVDGAAFGGGFLFKHPQIRELVFNFIEGAENGGLVGCRLGFVGMARLIGEGVTPARVEKQFRGLRAEGPQSAWTLNPGAAVRAFKAAGAAESDGGIESADRDTDLFVGSGDAALCGGD